MRQSACKLSCRAAGLPAAATAVEPHSGPVGRVALPLALAPRDVAKASGQTLVRAWSVAFCEHPEKPDGIVYLSRLNGHTNMAVFDRAIAQLQVVRKMKLIAAPGLASVLNGLKVSILEPDS
jgi:hypothetical protein